MSDEEKQLLAGRRFQVWDYSPSFSRLLIRSPRFEEGELNIDIIFWGVDFMNIASLLGEISIDIEEIDAKHKRFLVYSKGQIYTIVGVACKIMASDTEIFESPLDKI
jgi:hypothetical protein